MKIVNEILKALVMALLTIFLFITNYVIIRELASTATPEQHREININMNVKEE